MGLLEFLALPGQERTQRRDAFFGGLLNHFLGPTGIDQRIGALDMLNPVSDVGRAMQSSEAMMQPNITPMERVGHAGAMLTDVASVAAPGVAVKMAGGSTAQGVMESLLGIGGPTREGLDDAARRFAMDEDGALRLWHGSPHDFDRFSMDKIGTGTGQTVQGRGIYLTDSQSDALRFKEQTYRPNVDGQSIYRSGLSPDAQDLAWDYLKDNPIATGAQIAEYAKNDMAARLNEMPYSARRHYEGIISEFENVGQSVFENPSRVYEVSVSASPEDFLKYDDLLASGENVDTDAFRDAALAQGARGVQYKTGDVNNYVVFDDRLVSILGKDGDRYTPEGRAQSILDMLAEGRASEITDDMLDMGDPTLNARLNMYLFENYDLPMDEASRMARAGEMGYNVADTAPTATSAVEARGGASVANTPPTRNSSDISGVDNSGISVAKAAGGPDLYHGTDRDVLAFDSGRFGSNAGSWSGDGVYTTPDALEAEEYGDIIMPLSSRGKNPNVQILRDYNWSAPDGYSQHLAGQGYDATEMWVRDVDARTGEVADEWLKERVDFNPANIRSRFARFDPRLAHLRNLSAGLGGAALLGQYEPSAQDELEQYLGLLQ